MTISPKPLAFVDGWPINIANMSDAVNMICDAAEHREAFSAHTINLDHLVKLRDDQAFRDAYSTARFVMSDSAPISFLVSGGGKNIKRAPGADLVVPLALAAADRGVPVFLFGTSPATLSKAGGRLKQWSGGRLDIAGAVSPPLGFDPVGSAADEAMDLIAASGARLCFVALSPPKGELFAARAVARGIPVGFVCIGAALDFLSGQQRRAPKIFRVAGMEWLWRLTNNPQRLASRYWRCAGLLLRLLATQVFSTNFHQKPL